MQTIPQIKPTRGRAVPRGQQAPGALRVRLVTHDASALLTTVEAESASGQFAYTVLVREPFHDEATTANHVYEGNDAVCLADANGRDCRHVRAALLLVGLRRLERLRDSCQSRADAHPHSASYYASVVAEYDRQARETEDAIANLGFAAEVGR